MKKTIILLCTFFCLSLLQAHAYEVKTSAATIQTGSSRIHYPEFATHFSDTLKKHPSVSDCQVSLHATDASGLFNRLEIAIALEHDELITHLKNLRSLRFVTQNEQDRYIQSLQSSVRQSAADIFSEITSNQIIVTVVVK